MYAFCKCRFIPPHQSLTRQLPPEGKPSLHSACTANVAYMADMSNISLSCGLPLRFALIRRLRDKLLAVFFPPRGKPLHPLHFSQQDGRVEIRKLGRFCNSACFLIFCLLPEIVFTMFARAYKRLPLGGKKTASSLSRKRLMRGDKSEFPIEMYRSVPISN